eukprot:scaffold8420_cov334-Pinguiococcus_pyrenoidosus.AAC.1
MTALPTYATPHHMGFEEHDAVPQPTRYAVSPHVSPAGSATIETPRRDPQMEALAMSVRQAVEPPLQQR